MTKNIIIKTSVQKRFDSFMVHGRVLFFSAPCGFGKTVLADALLHGQNVLRQSAADLGCAIPPSEQDWDILLIDDLQLMQEEAGQQALCELIRSSPERRFVLLSRGVPPGCLTAFQYTGLMTVLEADDLLFDAGDVRRLFQLSGVNVTDSEIDGILKESVGYPLGVAITARCMSPDKPWTPELVARVFREVFLYFETAIYRRFDLPVRRFLLELAPFESFDLEMARMVSGDPRAGERLDWIFRYTTMLRYDDCQRFHFWSGFRAFLLWEMEREYTEEKRKALISRGGLYYELKEDYAHALECYTSGGDHSKVSELLVRNAELHPGMGHYAEMEKYYRSLPEAEILASPSLMQGMSMLCALAMDYEGSERWYGELQAFAERCGRQDAAGKQARSRLAWLDISLPQRGVNGLTETIPTVFRLLTNKEVALPSFSVTSALPSIMNGGKGVLAEIEAKEKEKTGIRTLKIGYNKVFGYYIEVSNSFKDQVPDTYIRKQTLVNGERYITQELKDLEHEILTASDRVVALEYELFTALRQEISAQSARIQRTAAAVAEVDALVSFAAVAVRNHYCRPTVDESGVIEIHDGRHPVVEQMLKDSLFVPNDTFMGEKEDRVAIITGPNMAGKSTYMRQVALIVLMAQMGSFVPAASARIGVVDRIFTRIGASDDLSAGASTFMVEMTEVAELLKNATAKSLLILDEIGRGTSTFDGMSIARAVLEYCADKKLLGAKTLFATHYHELTELENTLPGTVNYNIAVKTRGEDIIFLRKILPGGADRSYGIEVAKLAGLPDKVVQRAKTVLKELEEENGVQYVAARKEEDQVSLTAIGEGEVLDALRRCQVETLTPLEAMNLIYEWKQKLK